MQKFKDYQDKMVGMHLFTLQLSHQPLPTKHTLWTHMQYPTGESHTPKIRKCVLLPHIYLKHPHTHPPHINQTHTRITHTEKNTKCYTLISTHLLWTHIQAHPLNFQSAFSLLKIWMSNQRQPNSWINLRKWKLWSETNRLGWKRRKNIVQETELNFQIP